MTDSSQTAGTNLFAKLSFLVVDDFENFRLSMRQMLRSCGADRIELYTESFAVRHASMGKAASEPFAQAATWAHEAGLGVNAGHDLNLQNLRDFAESVPHLAEVSIGHALIADALYLGMSNAVAQYRACLTPRA